MITLSHLRIETADALPFVREKVRAALVIAGVRAAAASQVTMVLSQTVRGGLPADIYIRLEGHPPAIRLDPAGIAGPYRQISLPRMPSDEEVGRMRQALARMTREELLYDLERQVQDRTAELAHERERSERLLKSMMPAPIAERMKSGEIIADSHDASVLFADIHGFTAWARERTAREVVSILDHIFSAFDRVAERHGLEKIKTIGDAYLAAAGLPEPQFDHVDRAVLAGLDIVASLPRLREDTGLDVSFRVGVHTGPVVAGVIGTQKLFYDIWGDTVNVASRMESHGQEGLVHVSDDVRRQLGDRYRVEDRGLMEIKNRGQIHTWFVHGLAPTRAASPKSAAATQPRSRRGAGAEAGSPRRRSPRSSGPSSTAPAPPHRS